MPNSLLADETHRRQKFLEGSQVLINGRLKAFAIFCAKAKIIPFKHPALPLTFAILLCHARVCVNIFRFGIKRLFRSHTVAFTVPKPFEQRLCFLVGEISRPAQQARQQLFFHTHSIRNFTSFFNSIKGKPRSDAPRLPDYMFLLHGAVRRCPRRC